MNKYTCPMHPQIIEDNPGKCPLCGMDLVPMGNTHKKMNDNHSEHSNQESPYDKHKGHHSQDFLKRFWICLGLTIPILLLSPTIQNWFGFDWSFPGDKYVLLILGSIIYFYGGMPFLKGMKGEIKSKSIGMMTLVAIAITVSYFYSVAVTFGLEGMDFFWELATLIDVMLLGHYIEMKSQMAASQALRSLVALLPNEVNVDKNGNTQTIPLSELQNGDTIIVKPGEKIAADGLVIDGNSSVDESMLTGESIPVKKEKDSKVIAGSINGNGMLRVKATGIGKDSYLNKVINLVQEAQKSKSKTQNLADTVAKWLTIIAISAGVLTFIYWYYYTQDLAFALQRMVTVMVTACPHALGVAIPLVVARSTTLAATNGLLIRNRTAFELSRNLSTIIFDKTGTLTKGSHTVQHIIPLTEKYSREELIQYAASVEQYSEHFIAQGIMQYVKGNQLQLWDTENFSYDEGIGVSGDTNGNKITVVGPNYFTKNNIPKPNIPPEINQDTETISFVIIDNEPVGIITSADSIREGSFTTIEKLHSMNIKAYLLTGDNERIATSVSNQLQMDGYFANVLPEQKQEKIIEFQNQNEIVGMTGDGINDAPALAKADVGLAIGSGTDVAAETADVILVNSDPRDVVRLINFGKATYNKMIQNLFWAVGYNVIAIPLAAGVLYPEFMLDPAVGAIMMSASTVIVAINASFLQFKKEI